MNVETNHHKKQRKLITGNLKKFEQKVIDFYLEFGRKSSRNLKLIEIYSYFRIYDTLTQKQLKQLRSHLKQLLMQVRILQMIV